MIDRLLNKRVVPVVVLDDAKDAEPLAQALLKGGLDLIEITFRTDAAEESIRRIAEAFPEMLVGAGTLLEVDQVDRARNAGASFGLAPGLNPAVVARAQAIGLEFSPGVMTPGEIEAGLALGCRLQKFFPAMAAGGPPMLKALAGPYAHTGVKFIPTGGIDRNNMNDFLALPVVAAVGGSWMVERKLIQAGDWTEITRLTKEALTGAP
jgi:2-dehydro-3-deoxyphosphogluconate aldolase/(4S)-4-hydroxy-2-oxoglutarate aldolase